MHTVLSSPNPGKPLRVAISTGIRHHGFERLCPSPDLKWSGCEFMINPPDGGSFDFWITFAKLAETKILSVAQENTLFIAGEPPSKRAYPIDYYAQFGHVVSCNPDDPHPNLHLSFLGLPWHVGLNRTTSDLEIGFSELNTLPPPEKINKISVVCSNKAKTQGQRDRLKFLEQLKSQLGDQLVHFGRGFEAIDDKLEAILPYRFHLALENCSIPHYWTEKLADAYLGWSFPVYVGAPNIHDYFPPKAICPVNVHDPDSAAETIARLLSTQPIREEYEAIGECRQQILHAYNPFSRFAFWAKTLYKPDLVFEPLQIKSHRAFKIKKSGILGWFSSN